MEMKIILNPDTKEAVTLESCEDEKYVKIYPSGYPEFGVGVNINELKLALRKFGTR